MHGELMEMESSALDLLEIGRPPSRWNFLLASPHGAESLPGALIPLRSVAMAEFMAGESTPTARSVLDIRQTRRHPSHLAFQQVSLRGARWHADRTAAMLSETTVG